MIAALEGQQHAPAALYPRERPGTHFTGGWVGPRAGLDGREISPHRDSIPDRQACCQLLYRLSYLTHIYGINIIVKIKSDCAVKYYWPKIFYLFCNGLQLCFV